MCLRRFRELAFIKFTQICQFQDHCTQLILCQSRPIHVSPCSKIIFYFMSYCLPSVKLTHNYNSFIHTYLFYFEFVARSRISGSNDISVISLWSKLQVVVYNGCIHLYFYQLCIRGFPFYTASSTILRIFVFSK